MTKMASRIVGSTAPSAGFVLAWLFLALGCAVDSDSSTGGSTAQAMGGAGGNSQSGAQTANGAGGTNGSQTSNTGSTAQSGSGGEGGMSDCEVDGTPGHCLDVSDCTGNNEPVAGHCPGAANIQCCIPFATSTCDPAAAPLPNAGLVEAPGIGGCLPGMLAVDNFCIDRFEASLVYQSDGSSFSPFHNPGSADVRAVSIEGAVPQGYIDQIQAGAACVAAGKRLCTDDEWLRACEGPDGYTYPYGDTDELGVCNDHRDVHPAVELYGTTDSWIYSHLDNACLNQLPMSLDTSGSNSGCVTAEGAFDMMGNVHEWTADPAGSFRGGYYVDTVLNGPGCHYVTTAHDTSYWDYSTGFRCCAD